MFKQPLQCLKCGSPFREAGLRVARSGNVELTCLKCHDLAFTVDLSFEYLEPVDDNGGALYAD